MARTDDGIDDATADDSRAADRAFWRSRRGLLELDLLLVPFAERRFRTLDASGRALYTELLDFEDVEIYAWIAGRETPPERFVAVIGQVREFHSLP